MHLVGTIRTKPQLPQKEFLKSLPLEKKESFTIFHHTDNINVVYKKVKTSKHVALVTTLHNRFTNVEDQKTEAHMFYNASKGGTDAFDMMCAASSTNRKTRRWPLCVFYGLLNICMKNAWILYDSRPHQYDRSTFSMDLTNTLCRLYAIARYQ